MKYFIAIIFISSVAILTPLLLVIMEFSKLWVTIGSGLVFAIALLLGALAAKKYQKKYGKGEIDVICDIGDV